MRLLSTLLLATGIAGAANAATIVKQNGDQYTTPALSTFSVTGADMDGMQTWARFSDGTTSGAVWADDPSAATDDGLAEAPGWFRITQSGSTFSDLSWTIVNLNDTLSITAFGFFGPSGDTVFDTTFGGASGSLGSELGKDFDISSLTATATYSDIVSIIPNAPVGDLYASLEVELDPQTLLAPNARAQFSQDTDIAETSGTIVRVPDGGSTAMLLGLGLVACGTLRRRLM